ncbi:MAG: lytic transglycosylase domain-containing protein, partial [Terriglobales bacterium]
MVLLTSACETASRRGATAPPLRATAPTLEAESAPASAPQPRLQEPSPAPRVDPVEALLARVQREYESGRANQAAGHLEAARKNFDRAFDLLLGWPAGVRSDPRLLQEFERLVESVHALEVAALKEGDGFSEQQAEPAPIDEANAVTFPMDPNLRARAEAGLRSVPSDIPLVINDVVAGYINYFTTTARGRGTLERAWARAGRYQQMISRILSEEGVPQDLIYLAQAESGFHPLALSRAGARGMWQFMASRAREYDLHRNWWLDERQDPEKSTRAAARHLRDLFHQFGDWHLALAAYNSGPGNVQKGVERTGYADFWELYRRSALPLETKNYVPIILAVAIIAKDPEQYGLAPMQPEPPMEVDRVVVNYPLDLRLAAEAVDA